MEQKVLIILNPNAGLKQGKRYLADIINLFCKERYEVSVSITQQSGDARQIVMDKAAEFDRIVCIGGDGTFNEVAAGIMSSGCDATVGYIPAGSTNDFASSLNIPKNIMKAAKMAVTGTPRNIDMGDFNGRYFSYIASFGAFTKASYATPQNVKNALGHIAYILEGIKELTSIQPYKVRFETDSESFEDDYIFGAISNSTSVGGILTLDPDVVDMNDGLFEILLVKSPKNIIELNECIAAITSQNYDNKMITFRSASRVEIFADPEMQWTLDGEHQSGCDKISVKNIHNALKIML